MLWSWLQLLWTYGNMVYVVYFAPRARQKAFLHQLENGVGEALPPPVRDRVLFYLRQSILTNYWFSSLRGTRPTPSEIQRGQLLGAITPFVDDLNDEYQLSSSEIFAQLEQAADPTESLEWRAIRYLYPTLQVHSTPLLEEVMPDALAAQDKSTVQAQSPPLSTTVLKRMNEEKGGFATLLYRGILEHPLAVNEKEVILLLGNTLQLINDLFDAHKDHQHGLQTLVNQFAIHGVEEELQAQIQQLIEAVKQLDYPTKRRMVFWRRVVPVLARGLVCIEQLRGCLTTAEGIIDFARCQRSDLICDMEKPANVWKSLRYSLFLMDSFK